MFLKSLKRDMYPRVEDFYNGKSVLITGAAGFVGMIILEILLRTCPGIESIYILLREKKGVKPKERMEKLFEKEIFNQLKADSPEALQKVRLVVGDVSQPDLGMSEEHVEQIMKNVTIVFHCAADLNFVKPLKFLMGVNAVGTHYVIELCKKLKEIEALVYTSTICSNCNRKEKIDEEVYRLPFPPQKFLQEFHNGTEESLEELVSLCHPHWPNGYTFTKCLAENFLLESASEVPCTVIRPSLVVATWKAPHPGFIEKNSAFALLCIGGGMGFIKVLFIDPENTLDFVPVDVVANCHIVAAWKIATGRSRVPFIVNCSSYGTVKSTIEDFKRAMMKMEKSFPLPNCFRTITDVELVKNLTKYRIISFYQHYVPAYVIDFLLKLSGKKLRLVSLYQLFDKAMMSSSFFTVFQGKYDTNNFHTLKDLDEDDKKKFYTDISEMTIEKIFYAIPKGSSFYDWKNDKRSREERKRKADQRLYFSEFIKYAFLLILFAVLYLVTTTTCQLFGIL